MVGSFGRVTKELLKVLEDYIKKNKERLIVAADTSSVNIYTDRKSNKI